MAFKIPLHVGFCLRVYLAAVGQFSVVRIFREKILEAITGERTKILHLVLLRSLFGFDDFIYNNQCQGCILCAGIFW